MKVGDIFKIKSNGFNKDPEIKVLEIKGTLARIIQTSLIGKGGILSHMNESWYGIEELNKRKNEILDSNN